MNHKWVLLRIYFIKSNDSEMTEKSMLIYIWGFMILVGVIYGALNGTIQEVGNQMISSAKEAISLCIVMAGVTALWMGIMQIATSAGLIEAMTGKMTPVINYLFPKLPKKHTSRKYIAANMIANLLGLGWAATPLGLKAMKELKNLEKERNYTGKQMNCASNEMCTFLVINISSLQLIPVNIIAYRSQYGSVNPSAIIMPAILATTISTAAAVVFCRIMNRREKW